jgi:hypothetical protein
MDIQDIHKTIVSLANLYSDLNNLLETDQCTVDIYQVLQQEKYKGFYETLNQSNVEELVLNILSNSLNNNILTRLQNLIERNIRIYKQHQQKFNGLDFYALYELDERNTFDNKLAILLKDREDIQNFEYPTEQEQNMLLKENQQEINQQKSERAGYIRTATWIRENYYSKIHELSQSFLSIINGYFPDEKGKIVQEAEANQKNSVVELPKIELNMIFRTKMYEKFLTLEQKLMEDKYLNENKQWIPTHKNKRPNIKYLIIFLVGL